MKHIPSAVKEKYDILGVIGEGAYGVVLKARKKDTNGTVAIKHFKQAPGYCTDMDIIERELKILQSLRFENVVELIEWFRDKKHCFLVFEYVEWNMLQVLQEHPDGLPVEQVRQLSFQLFSAIHWCHNHEIIHRDIKPENLLISKNFVLKLCDFGFARFCNTQTATEKYTDYVATRWYRSPELLVGSSYGKPVDIWACGCIMAELTTGQALFAGTSDIDQLYRIQKCLGSLPPKYLEAMKTSPKFFSDKFHSVNRSETLEQRYGHLFPPDVMHLFKGTLRLYAPERLTAEACVQHEAFAYLVQKQQQQQKRLQRQKQEQQQQQQQRPKTVIGSFNQSQAQHEHNNEMVHFSIPFVDSRLSKWHEESSEGQFRRRSPTIPSNNHVDNATEISFAGSSSVLAHQKHRNHPQLTDRTSNSHRQRHHHHHHQSKFVRAQSRTHSSSSDERAQVAAISQLSSNDTTDDDDDDLDILFPNHSRLRRKYVKNRSPNSPPPPLSRQQSLREQGHISPSPSLRCTSTGVILRPKHQQQQQQHSSTGFQSTSKDMGKKLKRFTVDTMDSRWHHQYQMVPNNQQNFDSNIYRPTMGIVPSLNANVYGVQINNDIQTRPKTRDINRSRTIDCHPPTVPSVETTPMLQRTPSRQTIAIHHQMVPDPMDQAEVDTTVSTTYSTSRSLEQQQQQNSNNNKYSWNIESRRPMNTNDNPIISSHGHNASFGRLFNSPSKNDFTAMNKIIMTHQRESNYDLIRSTRSSSKQNTHTLPKTPIESHRRQHANNHLFGVYPCARTAILHVTNAIMPASRQQSIRLPSTKSRHHDR